MSHSKQAPAWYSTWWHSNWAKRVLVVGLCAVFAGCTVSPQKSATTNASSGPGATAPSSTSASAPPESGSYHPKRNDLALFAMSLLDTPYAPRAAVALRPGLTAPGWCPMFTNRPRICRSKAVPLIWAKTPSRLTGHSSNPATWCFSTPWAHAIRMWVFMSEAGDLCMPATLEQGCAWTC